MNDSISRLTISLEYENLDANVAAEIAVRAKTTHMAPPAPAPYPQNGMYGGSQYGQHPQQIPVQTIPTQQPQPPNIANLITSLDGPALQKLLSQMGTNGQGPQTPQTPQTPYQPQQPSQQPSHSQDLASLLSSVTRQQSSQQQSPQEQNFPYAGYVQPSGQLSQQAYPQSNNQSSQHQYPQSNGQAPLQDYSVQNGPAHNVAYANNPALSQLLAKYRQ